MLWPYSVWKTGKPPGTIREGSKKPWNQYRPQYEVLGLTTEFLMCIPQSLVQRSVVLGWFLILIMKLIYLCSFHSAIFSVHSVVVLWTCSRLPNLLSWITAINKLWWPSNTSSIARLIPKILWRIRAFLLFVNGISLCWKQIHIFWWGGWG